MPWKKDSKEQQRLELVQAMMRNERSVAALCREAGICRQTAYKFRRRYEAAGRMGLMDESRATRTSERTKEWRARVFALRRCWPTWGGAKLLARLRRRWPGRRWPGQRTIERWLREAGLSRRRMPARCGRPRPVRCKLARSSNHVWTADLKGWFRTRDGRRIEPLTVRDLYSKYVLAVTPARTRERDVRRIFVALFRRYGVPKIIRTDHGLPFCGPGPHRLTKLSLWWHRLGIKVQFVRRNAGINNNAHEQMHQVLQREVANDPAPNYRAQCEVLMKWQRVYNHTRGHAALNLRTPAECYRPSAQPLPRLRAPCYPNQWTVRRVKHGGEIVLGGQRFHIGRAFARQPIGLSPRRDGAYLVYFERLKLGLLDPTRRPATLLHPLPIQAGRLTASPASPPLMQEKGGSFAPSLKPSPNFFSPAPSKLSAM
jgi:putative transposase